MQFMYAISPLQCQIARKHLKWHQSDLAKAADVSLSTVSSFENGFSPRRSSVIQIRNAFETVGIEFTEGDGVKRRDIHIAIYRDFDRCDKLLNDMQQTIKENGGDILCIVKSQQMLMQSLGFSNSEDHRQLEVIEDMASFKCLMSEAPTAPLYTPAIEFRTTLPHLIGPGTYFIYGNKYVQIMQESRDQLFFVLYNIPHNAHHYRNHFLYMWENAMPLRSSDIQQTRRVASSSAI